ncbi:hypothetical protein PCL_12541 [Purpureocillium lilacinum]|uniref:Uncharacterized protein n=1 Tax=Purpureocillium lilacinum TaxID=33203 RepID=A0A2U3E9I8_PURLI|nr:hypothetical protein PCL_12541 [Purpureocillium lilacinum]
MVGEGKLSRAKWLERAMEASRESGVGWGGGQPPYLVKTKAAASYFDENVADQRRDGRRGRPALPEYRATATLYATCAGNAAPRNADAILSFHLDRRQAGISVRPAPRCRSRERRKARAGPGRRLHLRRKRVGWRFFFWGQVPDDDVLGDVAGEVPLGRRRGQSAG